MDKKKEYLLDLIVRINTREKDVKVSSETTRWKALREAEALTDPALFPLLREIADDIPLLERFRKSRRQDLKITAEYAIQSINERAEQARKEASL